MPEGVVFAGENGEIINFRIGQTDYRAVFGPRQGEGYQENLVSGRSRRLRCVDTHPRTCTDDQEDVVHQICDMGFSRAQVIESLRIAQGDLSYAVQYLLAGSTRVPRQEQAHL